MPKRRNMSDNIRTNTTGRLTPCLQHKIDKTRDQFFMILMYDSAARIQEMLDLRVCDMRLGNTPTAILKGKGSKIRSVPLMPETINDFQNYMKLFFMWNNTAQGIPCTVSQSLSTHH